MTDNVPVTVVYVDDELEFKTTFDIVGPETTPVIVVPNGIVQFSAFEATCESKYVVDKARFAKEATSWAVFAPPVVRTSAETRYSPGYFGANLYTKIPVVFVTDPVNSVGLDSRMFVLATAKPFIDCCCGDALGNISSHHRLP